MYRFVRAPDGTQWQVGRRFLPWRPRTTRGRWHFLGEATEFLDGADNAVFLVIVLAVVALPVIVVAGVFIVEWSFLLLLLPLAAVARVISGQPWQIVATRRAPARRRAPTRRRAPARRRAPTRRRAPAPLGRSAAPVRVTPSAASSPYVRSVRGWKSSGRVIAEVRREIAAHGEPQSLLHSAYRQ